jgi:hypothetical protein
LINDETGTDLNRSLEFVPLQRGTNKTSSFHLTPENLTKFH